MIAYLTSEITNSSFIKIHQSFLIRSLSSSFLLNILFLLNLTSEVVSTVYQFLKFAESDNLLIKKIFQNCSNFFDFIISHYSKFLSSQKSLQSDSSIK